MKKKLLTLSLISALNAFNAFAAESDNFAAHSLALTDAKADINQLANNYLKKVVTDLNLKTILCRTDKSETALYIELKKYFGNHSNGQLVKDILYGETIAKNVLSLKESVYGNWTVSNGYLLGRKKAALSPLALSPLIRLGNESIGVDKLEHMFGMGFTYFKKHHLEGKSIKSVLKTGVIYEKTILGGNVIATGVFSYADLSANFNGMRFWNHVLQKQDDILGAENNRGPFITCENEKWSVNTDNAIDLSDYVDASFDESINCSKFANARGVRKFSRAIKSRGFSGCPIDSDKLLEMKAKYDILGIGHYIINTKGLETVSYFNEF